MLYYSRGLKEFNPTSRLRIQLVWTDFRIQTNKRKWWDFALSVPTMFRLVKYNANLGYAVGFQLLGFGIGIEVRSPK